LLQPPLLQPPVAQLFSAPQEFASTPAVDRQPRAPLAV